MIFYDCSTAPSPRRARMFIAEKGLEIETREISMVKGEQLSPEFLAVNPGATIPVLVTESGQMLNENIGIAAYLEAMSPEPPLMGTTPDEKGAILNWNAISEFQGGHSIAEALRNGNPHMKGRALPGPNDFEQIPELAKRGMQRVHLYFDKLNTQLEGREFVASDTFSLADITSFVFVDFARVVKVRVEDTHPHLKRWYETIKARPSAQL
ncbi:glutathione S-transferase family protein [Shimia thalassica]|uniref:glutathione S-transferase family protein n=1 Tax=Shimia thalassica TaxID=1715693 RepID=UPI002494C121|nr:glutathione S-transferase [Shimia thalassica]MDO6798691.1 glutathione S-transferase [Shimia thalassica]